MAQPAASTGQAARRGRKYNPDERNRMMVTNLLQRNLNISEGTRRTPREKKKVVNEPTFASFEEALEQLHKAGTDFDVSVSDIKPYLVQHKMDITSDEYVELCAVLCDLALQFGHTQFACELCTFVIESEEFQQAMSDKLTELTASYIMEPNNRLNSLPELLAHLLVTKWPKGHRHSVMDSNQILFTVVNAVMGWQQVLVNSTEQNDSEDDDLAAPPSVIQQCAQGMCDLCNAVQRSLWLSFPDVVDGFYAASKSLLISNVELPRSLKSSLLQLQLSFPKWAAPNSLKSSNAATQTVDAK